LENKDPTNYIDTDIEREKFELNIEDDNIEDDNIEDDNIEEIKDFMYTKNEKNIEEEHTQYDDNEEGTKQICKYC
jgi:hypothetical protein